MKRFIFVVLLVFTAQIAAATTWNDLGTSGVDTIASSNIQDNEGNVYIFGSGIAEDANETTIYRTNISDPTVWVAIGTLPAGVSSRWANAVYANDYVYFFPEFLVDSDMTTNTVYAAPVSPELGSIGSWSYVGQVPFYGITQDTFRTGRSIAYDDATNTFYVSGGKFFAYTRKLGNAKGILTGDSVHIAALRTGSSYTNTDDRASFLLLDPETYDIRAAFRASDLDIYDGIYDGSKFVYTLHDNSDVINVAFIDESSYTSNTYYSDITASSSALTYISPNYYVAGGKWIMQLDAAGSALGLYGTSVRSYGILADTTQLVVVGLAKTSGEGAAGIYETDGTELVYEEYTDFDRIRAADKHGTDYILVGQQNSPDVSYMLKVDSDLNSVWAYAYTRSTASGNYSFYDVLVHDDKYYAVGYDGSDHGLLFVADSSGNCILARTYDHINYIRKVVYNEDSGNIQISGSPTNITEVDEITGDIISNTKVASLIPTDNISAITLDASNSITTSGTYSGPQGFSRSYTTIYNNYLYLVAGEVRDASSDSISNTRNVWSAPITAHEPTPWTFVGWSAGGSHNYSQGITTNDKLILFGMTSNSVYETSNSGYITGLDGSGGITGWQAFGSSPPYKQIYPNMANEGEDIVYSLGGGAVSSGDPEDEVYKLRINSPTNTPTHTPTPTATTWDSAAAMPVSITASSAFIKGEYLFVFGDGGAGDSAGNVYRVPLDTYDPIVKMFTTLPEAGRYSSAFVSGSKYYYLPEHVTATGKTSGSIYRGLINDLGGLGSAYKVGDQDFYGNTWNAYTNRQVAFDPDNHRIYSYGGIADSTTTSVLAYTEISGSTIVDSYTTTLPFSTHGGYTAIYDGYLYNFGGMSSGSPTTSVMSAQINSDGSLSGTWTGQTSLPSSHHYGTLVQNGNMVYIYGGRESLGTASDTVIIGELGAGGTIVSWTTSTSPFSLSYGTGAFNAPLTLFNVGGETDAGTPVSDIWAFSLSTPTETYTPTVTATITLTETNTPFNTRTFTPTVTQTHTPTYTCTITQTHTITKTITSTHTITQTVTLTNTPTTTPTVTLTSTPEEFILLTTRNTYHGEVTIDSVGGTYTIVIPAAVAAHFPGGKWSIKVTRKNAQPGTIILVTKSGPQPGAIISVVDAETHAAYDCSVDPAYIFYSIYRDKP